MLLEQGAALPFGQSTPHTELHAVVECIGSTLEDHRAVPADDGGFALGGATNEELIGIGLTTACLRYPGDPRLGFGAR